jgi:hypothetical protein
MNSLNEPYYELTDVPNEKYKQLFEKFKDIDSLDISKWKVPHILGYFCRKYYNTYGVKYKFKFNSPAPSKSFEVFQVKKLASNLTSNPVLLKEYIDWVYDTKVIKAKRRLTSISFMTVEGVMNEYKFNVLLKQNNINDTVDRSTPLPDKYKTIFNGIGYPINTYGDLAFLHNMPDMPEDVKQAFIAAQNNGLELSALSKVV